MSVKSFSKKEAIKLGWEMTKKNLLFLIGITFVMGLIQFAPDILGQYTKEQDMLSGLIEIASYIVSIGVTLGSIKIYLNLVDGKKVEFADLFSLFKLNLIGRYFIASVIYGIAVVLGLFLLILPGIYIAIKYLFFAYFLVDKEMGIVESFSKSGEITRDRIWNLFLFGVLITLVLLLGLIAFGVGIFVAIPVVGLATAYAYRKLSPVAHHKSA